MSEEDVGVRVCEALVALEGAFARLEHAASHTESHASWSALEHALVPFKHPVDGGAFSMRELEDAFDELLPSTVMRRVHELKDAPPTAHSAGAVEAAACVWARVTECIDCMREVSERCRSEFSSPTLAAPPKGAKA